LSIIGYTDENGDFDIPVEAGALSGSVPLSVTVMAVNPDYTQTRPLDLALAAY